MRHHPGRYTNRTCISCKKESRVRRDGAGLRCRSCQCSQNSKNNIGKYKDISNQKFGKLLAIKPSHQVKKQYFWLCKCDCGNECIISGNRLRYNRTQSCGCIVKTQNGLSKSGAYRSWNAMMQRCYNEKSISYKRYGALGIKVCDYWHIFVNFLKDMGDRSDGFSLDRIDPWGNYELNNCRWATPKQQAINKRKYHKK